MLEKAEGAVTCAHCKGVGADTSCPYCRRAVCKGCLGPVGCPVPHPEEKRLGLGRRLRDIDDSGRFGCISRVLSSNSSLYDLRSMEPLRATYEKEGVSLESFGPEAMSAGRIVRPFWSYEIIGPADNQEKSYLGSLLAVTDHDGQRLSRTRFFDRPENHLEVEAKLTEDGELAVLISASRVDFVSLEGARPPRDIDLDGELIQCCAISLSANLVAIGTFDHVLVHGLSTGHRICRLKTGMGDTEAIAAGINSVVAISAEGNATTLRPKGDKWEKAMTSELEIRGALAPSELAVSPDGKLLAHRSSRKRVAVRDANLDLVQELGGHTDRVSFVRFVRGGKLLVTADDDNRVWFWPRQGDRFISGD